MYFEIHSDFDLPQSVIIKNQSVFLAIKTFVIVGPGYLRSLYNLYYYSFKRRETSLGLITKKRNIKQKVAYIKDFESLEIEVRLGYHSSRLLTENNAIYYPFSSANKFEVKLLILIPKKSLQLVTKKEFVSSNFILPRMEIVEKHFSELLSFNDIELYSKIYKQIKEKGNVPSTS